MLPPLDVFMPPSRELCAPLRQVAPDKADVSTPSREPLRMESSILRDCKSCYQVPHKQQGIRTTLGRRPKFLLLRS